MIAQAVIGRTHFGWSGCLHPSGVQGVWECGPEVFATLRPPATFWQRSALRECARLQIKRHALERAHRAEGFRDGAELEKRCGHKGTNLNASAEGVEQISPKD